MMVQITNRCRMACPHCLDAATPDGGLMDEATFGNALKLARDTQCPILTISGGEPSEHPLFLDFCKRTSNAGLMFGIATNGMWLGDQSAEWRMERIAKLNGFAGAQVYTNPKWYRLHEETIAKYRAQESRWAALEVNLETAEIRNMIDLGRAKDSKEAMAEVRASKYHCSCLTSHVTAAQTSSMSEFLRMMIMQVHMCTPLIDWQGEFHASESWLCQSFGNINRDDANTLFERLKSGRPCGKCLACKKYLSEDSPKMEMVRKLLGQEKIKLQEEENVTDHT